MDENLHNIDDLFKKALNEHGDIPSVSVWENIDKNLDKKKVLSISKKYQKLKWVAAALLIFSAGMAIYTWHTKMRNKELVRQNNTSRNVSAEKNSIIKKKPNIIDNNLSLNKFDAGTAAEKEKKVRTAVSESNTAKLSAVLAKPSKKIELNKEDQATETRKKSAADKTEEQKKTAFNKWEARGNKVLWLAEKNISEPFDNSLTLSAERVVADIATVHKKTPDLYTIDSINKSMPPYLETRTFKQIIKEEAALGQSKKTKAKPAKTPSVSATLFYSPDFVSSRVDNDRHDFREDDHNAIKSKERIEKALTTGVLINYNTSRKITIQTGLTFSTLTTNIQPKTIFARPDDRGNVSYRFNCSAGYSFVSLKAGNAPASGDSINALASTNTLQYISVPLFVGYNISIGKFSLQPGAGIAANFLTKGRIETVIAGAAGDEKASTNHIEGLNKAYLTGLISAGATYNLNKFLALGFTPVLRFAVTAINKDAPVKTYLNSFGLAAGLKIRLQ